MKERKNKITVPILVVVAIMLVIVCIMFAVRIADINSQLLPTINMTTTEPTVIKVEYAKMEAPIYNLVMPEQHKATLWEFINSVNKHEKITIAYLHMDYAGENRSYLYDDAYEINLFRTESMLTGEYLYFLEIHVPMSDPLLVQVTESNIDDIWTVVNTAVNEYNAAARSVQNGEKEYDEKTWLRIAGTIKKHLNNANIPLLEKINGTPILSC